MLIVARNLNPHAIGFRGEQIDFAIALHDEAIFEDVIVGDIGDDLEGLQRSEIGAHFFNCVDGGRIDVGIFFCFWRRRRFCFGFCFRLATAFRKDVRFKGRGQHGSCNGNENYGQDKLLYETRSRLRVGLAGGERLWDWIG